MIKNCTSEARIVISLGIRKSAVGLGCTFMKLLNICVAEQPLFDKTVKEKE